MEEHAFPVEKQPIYLQNGHEVENKVAVVRPDTGTVLGFVSPDYQIVMHQEVLEKTEAALLGIGSFTRSSLILSHGGAHFRASYDFTAHPEYITDSEGKRDEVVPRLTIRNSYDGRIMFGFTVGSMQLICTNGLRASRDIFDIVRKHTSGLSIENIIEKADRAMHYFHSGLLPRYRQMSEQRVEEPALYLDAMKESLPSSLMEKMEARILAKTAMRWTEWGIYSEFTSYLTHEYGMNRKKGVTPDRIDDLNKKVSAAFSI